MPKASLGIGVIGAWGRGRLAACAHQPEQGNRIVGGADVYDDALKNFQNKYGSDVFVTKDYRQLLDRDDIDAVFVTSPDFMHEEHAIAALRAGKHVYLEKPMAITIAGCDEILRTAYKTRSKLYLGHNMRHSDVIATMRRLVAEGTIGEVKVAWCRHFVGYGGDAYFKDWHADRSKSTGMLLQKGCHDIDNLHWICNGYSRRVVAMGALTLYDQIVDRRTEDERPDVSWRLENWPPLSQKGLNPVIDIEDVSMVLMALDNGVLASYQQCHYTPDGWRNYTIIGTEGRIENFGDYGEHEIRIWNQRCNHKPEADAVIKFEPKAGGHGGADPRIVDEFIRHVCDDGKMTTSPIAARNAVAAGCTATESLRNRSTPLDVPEPASELVDYFAQFTQS